LENDQEPLKKPKRCERSYYVASNYPRALKPCQKQSFGGCRVPELRSSIVRLCVNPEFCSVSAGVMLTQLSTKDDSFTMLGASLMVRIVDPAVHHSYRPSAGYGIGFEALGSISSGQRRS
jgi:hypothetical protein